MSGSAKRAVAVVFTLLLCGAILTAARQQAPQPQFRAGVDVVLVDVTVLDKSGQPIPDLLAQDFSIEVDGKKRPVAGAQYVVSGRTTALSALPATLHADRTPPSVFGTSAAALASEQRSIIVVVDTDNIRAGDGRGAMESLADYFDTLPASDQIGLLAHPFGTPRVGLTSDRNALRASLRQTVGTSHQQQSCDPTFGEAASGGIGWGGRVLPMGCQPNKSQLAMSKLTYRHQTKRLLDFLAEVASSLAVRIGRRSIVLVSEGLYADEETREDLRVLDEVFERARVVLYVIHLDFPFAEASAKGNAMLSRQSDDRIGFDAMAETAVAGGGEAIRAISRPTPAIKRIDAALSGSYILAFERVASDKDGKRLKLKIGVNRKGADVRSRTHVTIY